MSILHNDRECALLRYRMTPEHCRRTADRKDCVNGDISGMVVTRRVPSPRSVRHLLQVASVSASVVGKRVLHVKHGRSASSRASLRGESLLRGEVQLCYERTKLGGCDLSQLRDSGPRPESKSVEKSEPPIL